MIARFVIVGLIVCAGGCGGPRVVPVSGRITLDDKPLANATVIFEPLSEQKNPGPGSHGKTDADGRFALQLLTQDRQGAIVGWHRVSITAYEGGDEVPSSGSDMVFRRALLPDEYNADTKLKFEVPAAGTAEANFALRSVAAK